MDAEKGKRAGCKKHKKQESRAEQGTEIMGDNLVTFGATWQERDPISEILRKGREGRRGGGWFGAMVVKLPLARLSSFNLGIARSEE